VKGRLGVSDADCVRVQSEFDFSEQAILYLPKQMPPPKSPQYGEAVAREVRDLLIRTEGRARHVARAIPLDAVRGAVCALVFLAGGRCRRRTAELRHHRQAAIRFTGR